VRGGWRMYSSLHTTGLQTRPSFLRPPVSPHADSGCSSIAIPRRGARPTGSRRHRLCPSTRSVTIDLDSGGRPPFPGALGHLPPGTHGRGARESPGWRNGRRGGLKNLCPRGRAGSIPAPGISPMGWFESAAPGPGGARVGAPAGGPLAAGPRCRFASEACPRHVPLLTPGGSEPDHSLPLVHRADPPLHSSDRRPWNPVGPVPLPRRRTPRYRPNPCRLSRRSQPARPYHPTPPGECVGGIPIHTTNPVRWDEFSRHR